MVVPLGPGKFYGSSLPRPRIYDDVKFNSDRVDPPLPVTAPLLSWAEDAHWSMGGLNFKRMRLQGKIEGNVEKIRQFLEKKSSPAKVVPKPPVQVPSKVAPAKGGKGLEKAASVSPPPAPNVSKRKFMDLGDSESDDNEVVTVIKKKPARRLVGEFDRVAKKMESGQSEVETPSTNTKIGRVITRKLALDTKDSGDGKTHASKAPQRRLEKDSVKAIRKTPPTLRSSPRLAILRSC